jgi:hypothetical protein
MNADTLRVSRRPPPRQHVVLVPAGADPFFGEGTVRDLESDGSHAFPVSDASFGAVAITLEGLRGVHGFDHAVLMVAVAVSTAGVGATVLLADEPHSWSWGRWWARVWPYPGYSARRRTGGPCGGSPRSADCTDERLRSADPRTQAAAADGDPVRVRSRDVRVAPGATRPEPAGSLQADQGTPRRHVRPDLQDRSWPGQRDMGPP